MANKKENKRVSNKVDRVAKRSEQTKAAKAQKERLSGKMYGRPVKLSEVEFVKSN